MYVITALLIGFASSVLAGMFGIGGAAASTPALRLLLGTTPGIALGTTLPVIIPTAAAAAWEYDRRGLVVRGAAVAAAAAGVAGSVGGALLTAVINLNALMVVTGVFVLYVAAVTADRGIRGHPVGFEEDSGGDDPGGGEAGLGSRGAALAAATGLAAGLLSGLLGVGGGTVLVPGFLYVMRFPIKKAFGTSLVVISCMAVPGTVVHALLGHIDWALVLLLLAGSIPGAMLGARVSIRSAERLLYILFGSLLGAFGVIFIVSEILELIQ